MPTVCIGLPRALSFLFPKVPRVAMGITLMRESIIEHLAQQNATLFLLRSAVADAKLPAPQPVRDALARLGLGDGGLHPDQAAHAALAGRS